MWNVIEPDELLKCVDSTTAEIVNTSTGVELINPEWKVETINGVKRIVVNDELKSYIEAIGEVVLNE